MVLLIKTELGLLAEVIAVQLSDKYFYHPKDYPVALAEVPVNDLIVRISYREQNYRDLYEAEYHIGKNTNDNGPKYRRKSPVWNTGKFDGTPLLIHTNNNDVDVLEVEHIIISFKVEGKSFDYENFDVLPGRHSFDSMNTKIGKEIKLKVHLHLAKVLQKIVYKF